VFGRVVRRKIAKIFEPRTHKPAVRGLTARNPARDAGCARRRQSSQTRGPEQHKGFEAWVHGIGALSSRLRKTA